MQIELGTNLQHGLQSLALSLGNVRLVGASRIGKLVQTEATSYVKSHGLVEI